MSKKLYHIDISVKHNDPVDIRCGGPTVLGFDFYVEEGIFKGKKITTIERSVRDWLAKEDISHMGVFVREIKPYKIWNKDAMLKCMRETEL